jgi:hypothetical protein
LRSSTLDIRRPGVQDSEKNVQRLLRIHLKASRSLVGLRKQDVGLEAAEEALTKASEQLLTISKVLTDPAVSVELKEMAYAITTVSRRLIHIKQQEFAISGGQDTDENRGGAAVGARLSPKPPSLTGHDAKPFPEDEE